MKFKVLCVAALAFGLFVGQNSAFAEPPKGDAPKAHQGKDGRHGARQRIRAKVRKMMHHRHHRHHHAAKGAHKNPAPSTNAN